MQSIGIIEALSIQVCKETIMLLCIFLCVTAFTCFIYEQKITVHSYIQKEVHVIYSVMSRTT